MVEVGKVVEIKGNLAKVELETKDKCSGCSMANFCQLGDGRKRYIEVERIPDIKIGNKVQIEIESAHLLKGTMLLFFIPAVSFIVGIALGQMLVEGIVFPLIFGILFLAATFFFLHLGDKKLAEKRNKTRIITILQS